MSTVSVVILLLFFLLWWVAFAIAFYRVDRPQARSNAVVAGNLVQAVFHIFVPFVPIAKAFDKKLPVVEWKAYKFFSLSLAGLVVIVIVVEVLNYLIG